jgi:magnesium-transporting ATPase (P-type)
MTDKVVTQQKNRSLAERNDGIAEATISPETGFSEAEAQTRLAQYGYNEIREEPSGPLRGILKRLWGPIPWMLEAALVLEVLLGKVAGPALIAVWLAFSAVLGGLQERRARTALDLLRSRLQVSSRVRRGGSFPPERLFRAIRFTSGWAISCLLT